MSGGRETGNTLDYRHMEVLAQCWKCNHVQTRTTCAKELKDLRCQECGGALEILTIDGVPV